jgi:signal transduction histidine kinase
LDFGLCADEVGRHLSEFVFLLPDQKTHFNEMWNAGAQVEIWNGDVSHKAKNGAMHWFSASIMPNFDRTGKKCRHIVFLTDITSRVENEAALCASKNELRTLANHLDFSQEYDRKRIAREIHDELGQHLLALKIDLFSLQRSSALVQPQIKCKIPDLLQSVDETMEHVKCIINDLRPVALDFGLAEAIRTCVKSFTRRHNVSCDLLLSDNSCDLNEIVVTTLYRVLQESLVNISRHAQASRISIALQSSSESTSIEIYDNGIGMAAKRINRRKTFGLLGMKERVEILGGRLTIVSAIGKGTKVMVSMPHKSAFNVNLPLAQE